MSYVISYKSVILNLTSQVYAWFYFQLYNIYNDGNLSCQSYYICGNLTFDISVTVGNISLSPTLVCSLFSIDIHTYIRNNRILRREITFGALAIVPAHIENLRIARGGTLKSLVTRAGVENSTDNERTERLIVLRSRNRDSARSGILFALNIQLY